MIVQRMRAYRLDAIAALDGARAARGGSCGGPRGCGRHCHRLRGRSSGARGGGSVPRGGDRKDREREQCVEEGDGDTTEHAEYSELVRVEENFALAVGAEVCGKGFHSSLYLLAVAPLFDFILFSILSTS